MRVLPGLLRVLNKQLGHKDIVQKQALKAKWRGVCLASHHLEEVLHEGEHFTAYLYSLDVLLFFSLAKLTFPIFKKGKKTAYMLLPFPA